MVRVILSVVVLVASAQAFAVDQDYFKIDQVVVHEIPATSGATELTNSQSFYSCDGQSLGQTQFDLPLAGLSIADITNIGKIAWNIVQAGKPVENIKLDTANALPRGVRCWVDMAGWKMPLTKAYHIQMTNSYGTNVVDYTYRIVMMSGGSLNGVGAYITNASFIVDNLKVAWGFTFNATAEIPAVFNMGTQQSPLAAMQMNMKWSVDSPVSHLEFTKAYLVRGDNQIVSLN